MQDLLKEEDFYIEPYNPRRLFRLFYVIAVIEVLLIACLQRLDFTDVTITIFLIGPFITHLLMFFCDKRNTALTTSQIVFSNLLLTGIFYFGLLINRFIDNPRLFFSSLNIKGALYILLVLLVSYIISLTIILVYLKITRDIKKVKAAENL